MEGSPELLALGPEAVLYAILDSVVDGLRRSWPASTGTSTRSRPRSSAATRASRGGSTSLSGEVIEFQRSTRPLHGMLDALEAGFEKYGTNEEPAAPPARRRRPRHHRLRAGRRVPTGLSDILTVNATLVSQAQNEEVRRLTEASIGQNEEVKHLGLGRDHLRADADRDDLRHELRHAGACTGHWGTRSRWR